MPIEVLVTIPFSEELISQLSAISPKINVTAIPVPKASEISAEIWKRTEVLYTGHVLPELEQVPALRWVQFHFAGIDRYTDEPVLQKDGLLITTLSGAATPQVAEHVLAMMLALSRKLPALLASQKKSEWPKDRFERFSPFELNGKTVGIIGYGSIGRQIARLLQPFGVTILATKRNGFDPRDDGYVVEGTGDPQGDLVHRLYPPQALRSMLKECHFIVVTVPMTAETNNMVNAAIFDVLKPGSYLIDVSRGDVVNHSDLIDAIKSNKLAGAALDVFAEEPLPRSSPLWQNPNIIITPHISGGSERYKERAAALFSENMLRYLSGLQLYNLFDRKRGY
jgi:phosphoglycerate dehydrogenase-like enzyme